MTALTQWTRPTSYGGFSPDGDYIVLTRTRNSDALTESNWDTACTIFADAGHMVEWYHSDDGTRPHVYFWRAGCSMIGWIEYLMVHQDAPAGAIAVAQSIADSLADYPALNEDDWSEREYRETCDYWSDCSVRERADIIRDSGSTASIFAARRNELPSDNGYVMDWIRP